MIVQFTVHDFKVFLWLNSNKLSLNVKNPQFLVFSLRKHIITNTDMGINN